jgi:hypothetical protein
LTQLLPARRTFWAERCAWMAATLKEGADEGDNTWSEFALVRSEPPQSVTVPRITTLLMDPSTGAGSMMCALGGT